MLVVLRALRRSVVRRLDRMFAHAGLVYINIGSDVGRLPPLQVTCLLSLILKVV
jgi:hypothetical protein